MGNDHSSEIAALEKNATELRKEAHDRSAAFDLWTRDQTEAREVRRRDELDREERQRQDREDRQREIREDRQREDRAREDRQREERAREDRQREDRIREERQNEARHIRELEEIRIREERIRKEKEDEIRIREERIRKEKEDEIRIREEGIRKEKEEEMRIKEERIKKEKEEEIRIREERIRKEKEEEIRIREDKIRKEKEEEIRIREEGIRKKNEEKAEKEKKRMENIAELRADIQKIKPGESFEFPDEDIIFPKRLNIGLFGATGIGKTSLMNSLKFAVNGELKEKHREQAAPDDFEGGHTTRRMAVRITPYLTFVDNRGIGEEDLVKDGAAEELIIQLEGRSSFASEVDWGRSSPPDDMEVDETKKIYCTVLVFSARSVSTVQTIVAKFVVRLLKWQGRFPLAVITHLDDATKEQLDNMRLALRMAGIVDVYEVANITNEKKDLELVYQENLLKLVHKCVKDGDRIFELRREIELEEEEKKERKNKLAD